MEMQVQKKTMKVLTSLIAAALLVLVVGCAPAEEPAAAPTDSGTTPAPTAGAGTAAPANPNAPNASGPGAGVQETMEAPE